MRSDRLTGTLALSALVVLAVATTGLAMLQTRAAREQVWLAEPIVFSRHRPPAQALPRVEAQLGYDLQAVGNGYAVPRSFLASLPPALGEVERAETRKALFIRTVLPLILRSNELIGEDRARLSRLKAKRDSGAAFDRFEEAWLLRLAARYRIKPNGAPEDIGWAALEHRMQPVPPSLAIAQAAIESGWGTSRFAAEGRAIYGQWLWGDGEGIVPLRRAEGATHKIRSFDYLIQSVVAYMNNLNRHPAYADLRRRRANAAAAGGTVSGLDLTAALAQYSERREAYVDDLQAIITGNRLDRLDNARLAVR